MDEKSPLTEQVPETIGRYKIQECIGSGAMGAVYKAFDPLIKRMLAIKTIRLDIPKGGPQYRSFKERFYHEARMSGNLSHPNIVTLFDIVEEADLFLAMEFVEGETIAARLEKGYKFKPEEVISLASQIASALDYAHSKGIIHRDVKPSNLIISEGEKVKVTDFGIAKLIDAEMTQSGTLLGTPSYMSPEQAMGDKLDGRSDIFSLGVCCFEMLSGEQPFPGNNVTSILYKLVHVDPIEPANLEMHGLVPEKWHEVFNKVLAKKPADRYQTAGAFVHDLEFCLGTWFSALGTEDTITEVLPTLEATAPVRKIPAAPAPPVEATVPMPVLPASPPSTSARKASPPSPANGPVEEIAATVVLNAPPLPVASKPGPGSAPKDDSATVVLKPPPPARVPPTPTPEIEATVVLAPPELTGAVEAPRPPAPTSRAVPAVPKARAVPEAAPTMPATHRPATRAGIPASVIVGGAALVFVLALAIAGVVVWKKMGATPRVTTTAAVPLATASPPPAVEPPPPAPPVAAPGSLHVETLPSGAEIAINGEVKGTTPLDLTGLPPGSYELRLELKGYEGKTQSISITPEAPRAEVSLALARAAAVMGTADILSTPFGAAVAVDGSKVGLTPLAEFKIRPGTHRVELSKDGYEPWSGTLTVTTGQKGRLDVPLKAKPVAPAPPAADTPDPNRIYANTAAEVDTPAKKASGESVSYPDGAPRLKSGEAVSVRVSFVVTESGEVTEAKIVESGGKILDEAVLSTIRTWRYQPAVKKGTRVKVRLELRQTFRAG